MERGTGGEVAPQLPDWKPFRFVLPQTTTIPERAQVSVPAPKRGSRRARRAGRRWSLPPGLTLFLLLAGLYLLTSGGHTYSYDEETMFGLTESIVERGSFVVPTCSGCTVLRSIPMPEGRNYSR